jgi:hypothetical protein
MTSKNKRLKTSLSNVAQTLMLKYQITFENQRDFLLRDFSEMFIGSSRGAAMYRVAKVRQGWSPLCN